MQTQMCFRTIPLCITRRYTIPMHVGGIFFMVYSTVRIQATQLIIVLSNKTKNGTNLTFPCFYFSM